MSSLCSGSQFCCCGEATFGPRNGVDLADPGALYPLGIEAFVPDAGLINFEVVGDRFPYRRPAALDPGGSRQPLVIQWERSGLVLPKRHQQHHVRADLPGIEIVHVAEKIADEQRQEGEFFRAGHRELLAALSPG